MSIASILKSNVGIFEKAARLKITFAFKGTISIYDLWDMKAGELDALYRSLNKELKNSVSEGEGLITPRKTGVDAILELKAEIVKYVYTVLEAENDKKSKAADRKRRSDEVLARMAKKQDEALDGMSIEDLKKELDAINAEGDDE